MNIKIDALNYYGATKKYQLHFPALREDIEADVVIIGGGFSGINTALELAEQGITNVVVLEARHLGYGGTGRNGGQVMAGIGHDIEAVKKHVGKEGLETLFKIANLGAGIIRERIRKYNIDADFVPGYGYLAYNQRQLKTLRQWEKEFKAATPDEEIELYTGKEVQQVVGSEVYCGALKHMGGGQIHSLNMLLGSAQAAHSLGVKIFESSPVVEVNYGKQVQVRTAMGSVKAAKLLWACDSFLNNMEPEIYNKTLVTYSYQVSTEPLSDELIERISPLRGAFSDIRPVINYYRVTRENRLLFGSATRFLEYTPNDFAAWNRTLACDSFLNNMEPEIYNKTLVTYSYQVSTEPLSDELIERISPLRGAFSDIRPVINYYRVTRENRLLFGSATRFLEYTPNDFAAWNRTLLAEVFPYLKDVKIDFAWGGPMACSANLFPQIGTLRDHNNVFYVQGYSGFGVTPSHIVCKILAEGINGGSDRYRLLSSIPHATIHGRDSLRLLLVTAGKLMHQTAGFWKGRS